MDNNETQKAPLSGTDTFDVKVGPQTLEEIFREFDEWAGRLDKIGDKHPIHMGYFAGDDESYHSFLEHAQGILNVQPENLFTCPIFRESGIEVETYLSKNIPLFNQRGGRYAIISVPDFERLFRGNREMGDGYTWRIAHDYDQEIRGDDVRGRFPGLLGRILILSHIGFSEGQKAFNTAYRAAALSQFKSFLYSAAIPND